MYASMSAPHRSLLGRERFGLLNIGRCVVLFTLAGFILSACGQPVANGAVIATRIVPSLAAPPGNVQISTEAIAQRLDLELKQANDVAGIPGENGRVPLDILLSVKQIERLQFVQELARLEVDGQLRVIAGLRAQVMTDPTLAGWQKGNIAAILDQTAAGLNVLRIQITQQDQMTDQARADITTIAFFRVNNLLVPQTHLLIAAYQMQQLAVTYDAQRAALQRQIIAQQLTDPNIAPAQAATNAMKTQVSAMLLASQRAAAVLLGLRAIDYPAYQSGLAGARQTLLTGAGAGDRAAAYRQQALSDLGI